MKVSSFSGGEQRIVLIGMIVDSSVLGRVSTKWKKHGNFKDQWSNLIGEWCVDFFKEYGKAPGKTIRSIFEKWAEENQEHGSIENVEGFLQGLSDEYAHLEKESNSDYVIDMAEDHFNKIQIMELNENLEGDLGTKGIAKALERITDFKKVMMSQESGIDVIQDEQATEDAYSKKSESIVQFPGAMGEFHDNAFERDGFIAFMSPEKRGKSFHLIDVALRASIQRRKTAFFTVGDMSQHQILRRMTSRFLKRPNQPGAMRYPTSISFDVGDEEPSISYEVRQFREPVTGKQAVEGMRMFWEKWGVKEESYFKLACYPCMSITIPEIAGVIDGWRMEGWSPDVVVIDYMDVLAPTPGYREARDQINMAWAAARSLSQKLHCLVVTATQSDTASYTANTLAMENFSGDKRKLSHVTGMIGINQNAMEKSKSIYRYNWVVLREQENIGREAFAAACLPVCNPCVKSCWGKELTSQYGQASV